MIEHCNPRTHLSKQEPDVVLDVMVGLLPRLWRPASVPFEPLAREVSRWLKELKRAYERAEEPYERSLLNGSVDALKSL